MQVSKLAAMKRKEAPVDWLPATQTLATISTIAMVKNPLQTAAAPLLIDFYLSPEGQRAPSSGGKNSPQKRGKKPVQGYRSAHGKR
jgi:ABC-type Fe3+ transport system substrate-binding protein